NCFVFFFSSRRRHTRSKRDWSSDVCSSDLGAHPSLDDRKNFGRTEMQVSAAEAYALVAYQVGAFQALCIAAGVEMNHVKPHGAQIGRASCRERVERSEVVVALERSVVVDEG